MEARARVREFLRGRPADRPPLVPFATEFGARLEQIARERLRQDPNTLTRALLAAQELFGLDAVVLEVPPEPVADAIRTDDPPGERLAVEHDTIERLRILLGERAGLVLALPGPNTLAGLLGRRATADELDELALAALEAGKSLDLRHVDALAVVERRPLEKGEVGALGAALAPFWNSAVYYSIPSVLVCACAGAEAATVAADAVVVWAGASPEELLEAGARCVGVLLRPGTDAVLPPLPLGGFYTTAGELPAETEIEWVKAVAGAVGAAGSA